MKLHGLDSESGVWIPCTKIGEENGEFEVKWSGYGNSTAWLAGLKIRKPIIKRPLRVQPKKSDWPLLKHPSFAQRGDKVVIRRDDGSTGAQLIVYINDPYNGHVFTTCCQTIRYELLIEHVAAGPNPAIVEASDGPQSPVDDASTSSSTSVPCEPAEGPSEQSSTIVKKRGNAKQKTTGNKQKGRSKGNSKGKQPAKASSKKTQAEKPPTQKRKKTKQSGQAPKFLNVTRTGDGITVIESHNRAGYPLLKDAQLSEGHTRPSPLQDQTPTEQARTSHQQQLDTDRLPEPSMDNRLDFPESTRLTVQPARHTTQPARHTAQPAQQTARPAQQTAQPAQHTVQPTQLTTQPAQLTSQPVQLNVQRAQPNVQPAHLTIQPDQLTQLNVRWAPDSPQREATSNNLYQTAETPAHHRDTNLHQITPSHHILTTPPSSIIRTTQSQHPQHLIRRPLGDITNIRPQGNSVSPTMSRGQIPAVVDQMRAIREEVSSLKEEMTRRILILEAKYETLEEKTRGLVDESSTRSAQSVADAIGESLSVLVENADPAGDVITDDIRKELQNHADMPRDVGRRLARFYFTDQERMESNCNGIGDKKALDPRRLELMQTSFFSIVPTPLHRRKMVWKVVTQALDAEIRSKIAYRKRKSL